MLVKFFCGMTCSVVLTISSLDCLVALDGLLIVLLSSFDGCFLFCGSNCSLGRLQDSNAVLSHFNEYSENCFNEVSGDFSKNTRLLRSMKSDLDYIFQKLRYIIIISGCILIVVTCWLIIGCLDFLSFKL